MRQRVSRLIVGALFLLLFVLPSQRAASQLDALPPSCETLAFSTEEDFVTQGPEPADGIPIISAGDLLSIRTDAAGNVAGVICARNTTLLTQFDVTVDLGLDAVDVISAERALVAFSTELDSPNEGQFTEGDLLMTDGALILNQALTTLWQVGYDIGLDAVHFIGTQDEIQGFLEAVREASPVDSGVLFELFDAFEGVDIWFSTEGTWPFGEAGGFLDGDLLSARTGTVVIHQMDLPDPSVPAGIPQDGVDFGLDAVTTDRAGDREELIFSTEILYRGDVVFTDGDAIRRGNGVARTNDDLIGPFKPLVSELGLDAVHGDVGEGPTIIYLPAILKLFP
jgi:hypothetical protein